MQSTTLLEVVFLVILVVMAGCIIAMQSRWGKTLFGGSGTPRFVPPENQFSFGLNNTMIQLKNLTRKSEIIPCVDLEPNSDGSFSIKFLHYGGNINYGWTEPSADKIVDNSTGVWLNSITGNITRITPGAPPVIEVANTPIARDKTFVMKYSPDGTVSVQFNDEKDKVVATGVPKNLVPALFLEPETAPRHDFGFMACGGCALLRLD